MPTLQERLERNMKTLAECQAKLADQDYKDRLGPLMGVLDASWAIELLEAELAAQKVAA